MASETFTEPELKHLNLPVLIVHGGGDPIFPIAHALGHRSHS
jgi:pimeloyl-ACP methyl ester carboxylesterase